MPRPSTGSRVSRSAAFPSPGHDHNRCSDDAMALAEGRCIERGQRLTAIPHGLPAALLHRPSARGAYDIIQQLSPSGLRLAPITTYRALEFLQENGLVHRIASRNAVIACVHNHNAGDTAVFLL